MSNSKRGLKFIIKSFGKALTVNFIFSKLKGTGYGCDPTGDVFERGLDFGLAFRGSN